MMSFKIQLASTTTFYNFKNRIHIEWRRNPFCDITTEWPALKRPAFHKDASFFDIENNDMYDLFVNFSVTHEDACINLVNLFCSAA